MRTLEGAKPRPRSVRTGIVVGLAIVAIVLLVSVLAAGDRPAAAHPARNACGVCLERSPLLSPERFSSWNNPDVKNAYEAAAKYPATIDLLHCFCECKESPREGHKTLLTCFTSQHAAGCGICQREAILAAKLKNGGMSDEDVERTVESLHRTDGHPPTKGRGI